MKRSQVVDSLTRDMLLTVISSVVTGTLGALVLILLTFLLNAEAQAADGSMSEGNPDSARSGTLVLKTLDGRRLEDAPRVGTRVDMKINGMVNRVSVHQRFRNPGGDWIEGVYVFPLPEDSAVDRLRMRIGERVIEGEIRERQEAKQTYEKAKRAGKRASLLTQERPNIFTTAVANIPPRADILVEIEYQQFLRYEQDRFSLRFPLVVAPRYIPGAPTPQDEILSFSGEGWAAATDRVPDARRITPPVVDIAEGATGEVDIGIDLDAGFPLAKLQSSYHSVDIKDLGSGRYRIDLTSPAGQDRDFELVWIPDAGQAPEAAFFREDWNGENYGMVMLMPPRHPPTEKIQSREAVFVLDVSGSMHGSSITQAREAIRAALNRLGPADRFNLIHFNHRTGSLFGSAVPADSRNLSLALSYLDGLEAEGGTEMRSALERALRASGSSTLLRQVIFLTDGSVGNENELFSVIRENLGSSRLFTVGIGSAPNGHFMTRAAEFGRGTFTYIGDLAEVRDKVADLFGKLESPVLTDVKVLWPNDAGIEVWPRRIPDLYAGEPVVLALRAPALDGKVEIQGRIGSTVWRRKLRLQGGAGHTGIHALWARRKIKALSATPPRARDGETVKAEIIRVALSHHLVSRHTSLVAVDKTPARPADKGLATKPVPVSLPAGWRADRVFGSLPQTATSAPLQLLTGILAILLALLIHRRRSGVVG